MTSNNSHLPQRAADATDVGGSTEKERSTTFIVPATKATTADPQSDISFLEDIEKELMRGDVPFRTDDRLDHSVPKAKQRQTDSMSQSVIIPGPIAEGRSLHEQSANLKPDVSKELPSEVAQAPSTVSLSGTTVSIGDMARSTRGQAKKHVQEQLNTSIKPQVEDILSTFDQTQLYRDIPQEAKVALSGTGSDSCQPPVSRTAVSSLTSDVPKTKESEFVAEKSTDKCARKKTQQVNPSPRIPVEEVITASEMVLAYKDPETESAATPQLMEYGSSTCETSQQGVRTKAEQDIRRTMPENAHLEMGKSSSLEATAVPGAHSRASIVHIQPEREKHQPTNSTSAKVPPTSLSLKTDIKQQHYGPTKNDQEKCEYSALQTKCPSMRPAPKHEKPVKVDNLKQFEGMKTKTAQAVRAEDKPEEHASGNLSTHSARSSSASRNQAKTSKRKELNEALYTTERQTIQSQAHLQSKEPLSSVSRTERNTHRKYSPGKPNTVGNEASRQTQLVREVEDRFSASPMKQVHADNSKNASKSTSLYRVAASLHTTLNQEGSNGRTRRTPPRPGAQNSETNSASETTKHVSRMTPRRPTSASMAQRTGSRSLSPSKTVRARPSSAMLSASPNTVSNKGRGNLTKHADEITQGTSKQSCTVTLTQTRVSTKPVAEEVSNPPKAAELKNTKAGSRVTRMTSHTRNVATDIFEERASSRGWVSCINASNSVLNQKAPLSPTKGIFHGQVDLRTKVTSQRKKIEK